jgi:hypothetical protein
MSLFEEMNHMRRIYTLALLLAWGIALNGFQQPLKAQEVLLDDNFEFFELGETWQEHAGGAPDIALDVIFANDSEVLQMISSGFSDEFFGIETITPISLVGLTDLTIDARLRPINQGVEGSIAAAEVALIGSSGDFIRAYASNNAGPDPESINDWADGYEDSFGNILSSGGWPHCDLACDAMRNFVLVITAEGTTIQAFDDIDDPELPTWEATVDDFTLADLGSSVTIALRQLAIDGGDNVAGFFDYVYVTTSGVSVVPGDFDGNGILDALDIDALTAASASGENQSQYDLNNDGLVNVADVNAWITGGDVYNSYSGDANLDREFNSGDLVTLFVAGKYETGNPAVWTEGDFNGDGIFNTGDFVTALSGGGYEVGPRTAVAAVPEPASATLLLLGLLMFVRRRP